MNFKPENFRTFDAETPSWVEIRTMKSPLILIKGTGEAAYARTVGDKDLLIERFDESTDLLLWPWEGEWRTEVFRLSRQDLDKFYRSPKK